MTRLDKFRELYPDAKLTDKKIIQLCVHREVEPVTDEECESYPERGSSDVALCKECWNKETGGKAK